jgi:drug/metabolite transporter (DMT)-like permease
MIGFASWVLGIERLTWRWPLAAGTALLGLMLALDVLHTIPDIGGTALALVAAAGWTVTLLINRRIVSGGDSRPVTLHMMLAAAVVNAIACMLSGGLAFPQGAVGWLSLAGSVAAYCFASIGTFMAVAMSGAVRAGLLMNFEPIASLILGVVLLDQVLSTHQVIGAALVVGALIAANRATAPVTPSR